MARHVSGLAAAVLALTCASALALPTTWEMAGAIDEFDAGTGPDNIDLPIGVGSSFRVLVNFDTTTPLTATAAAPGFRFANFDVVGSSGLDLSIAAYVGAYGPFINRSAPATSPTDGGSIIVRDRVNFPTLIDGYSFGSVTLDVETGVTTSLGVVIRGDNDSLVSPANLLPLLPPAALTTPASLAALPVAVFQVCRWDSAGSIANCNKGSFNGRIAAVTAPTFGANWFLSARDCKYIVTSSGAVAGTSPSDCIFVRPDGQRRLGFGRLMDNFSGMGLDGFDLTFEPASPFPGATNGQSLGTVTGKVTFGGPAGLPILRGASLPSDISRTNSNLLAYQRYDYQGPATPMPLIVDLTYGIADHSFDTSIAEVGLRPGGATIGAVLAIVDAAKVSVPQVANTPFNAIVCGEEGKDGPLADWPAGSVLGSAGFLSAEGQKNAAAATVLDVRSCADPAQPVQLQADQSFIVASSMQMPARGNWTLGTQPLANGYVDARNTMRVTFDPSAPPAVVQNLVDNIVPACDDCAVAEEVAVSVDVRPGDGSCINPKLRGVIPAAFLGSATFDASTIRIDDNLRLGNLSPRMQKGRAQCALQDVNADGFLDLVCQFDNVESNWTSGQSTATLSGKLVNGLPVAGTDSICVR